LTTRAGPGTLAPDEPGAALKLAAAVGLVALALAACGDRTVEHGDGGAVRADGAADGVQDAGPPLCDGSTDTPPAYMCNNPTPTCPAGPCPSLPLGSGGCEDVGGLFGHPGVGADAGRPEGCWVYLSYGNPYYCGSPQPCYCSRMLPDAGLAWVCPL
jgi:hypothetical protein